LKKYAACCDHSLATCILIRAIFLLVYASSAPFLLGDDAAAQVFAELTGVSVMVQKRPYAERMVEFRPFACSDFVVPMLTRLCPSGEKMDRCVRSAHI